MVISFLCMMIASITAAVLPINGQTTGNVSNSYAILAFPSKYVFFAVILIYISILHWFYNQWQMVRKHNFTITLFQTILFVSSMIFQILWIYFWLQEQFIASSVVLFISTLLFGIYYLLMPVDNTFTGRLPISFYLAWLILLFMINIAMMFVYYHWLGVGFGLSQPLWAVILLTFVMAIALHIRFHHYDPYFPVLFIWFFIGIAIANNFEELLVSTSAVFLSGVLVAGILFISKKKPSAF